MNSSVILAGVSPRRTSVLLRRVRTVQSRIDQTFFAQPAVTVFEHHLKCYGLVSEFLLGFVRAAEQVGREELCLFRSKVGLPARQVRTPEREPACSFGNEGWNGALRYRTIEQCADSLHHFEKGRIDAAEQIVMPGPPALECSHVRSGHFSGMAKGSAARGHTGEATLLDQSEEARPPRGVVPPNDVGRIQNDRVETLLDRLEDRPLELESIYVESLRRAHTAGIDTPRIELLHALLALGEKQ